MLLYTEFEVKHMDEYTKQIQAWWEETADSDWYASRRTQEAIEALLSDPKGAFALQVFALLEKRLGGFAGKRVLVPSCGDCHAAFALSVLGADVTASDISIKQLDYAKGIAQRCGLRMQFIQADTMKLEPFAGNTFDLVYTSNGVHTWIDRPDKMYESIARVLKNGGLSVMWDIHPFQRPFEGAVFAQPKVVKAYDDVAPQEHNHWRVMDLVNSMARSGLCIVEMLELNGGTDYWYRYDEKRDERAADWQQNPMAALPTHICIAARKER